MKLHRYHKLYMDIARRVAEMSYARRLHVGAVIVKDGRIISMGWNGMPAGWDNNCENIEWMDRGAGGWLGPEEIEERWPLEGIYMDKDGEEYVTRYRLKTKLEVLHAESNAIAKLAKSNDSGSGADLFVTHAPCIECAKLIHQSGVSRVFYSENYRDDSGVRFLENSGIEINKL